MNTALFQNPILPLSAFDTVTPQYVRSNMICCHELAAKLEKGCIDHGVRFNRVYLPPIDTLSVFWACSHLLVHDALQVLRQKGYDYDLQSITEPIALWCSASSV